MASQEDIAHQQKLLEIHRRNLALYLEQRSAQGGTAYVLPVVANGIRENRDQIARIKNILRKWGVDVPDLEDDEEPPAHQGAVLPQLTSRPNAGPPNITVNFHGGDFRGSNLPIGSEITGGLSQQSGGATMSTFDQRGWNVSGGNIYNIAGDMNMSANPSKDEFLAALRQLRAEFDKAQDLPADKAEEMKEDLDSAIKAVDKPQPNKDRAVERLTTIQKVLDGFKGSAESALALGKLIGQIILATQGIHF
jgi:hypothetical protein